MAPIMGMEILKPVIVLLVWTMTMWVWMYATRLPAINRLPKDGSPDADRGWTKEKLEELLPREIQWKAHNYNHLHEAPTLFYAAALVLAIIGQGDGVNAIIAWVYVALRIVHSIWQATVNRVAIRFGLFTLSTLAVMALILHAAMAVFGWY